MTLDREQINRATIGAGTIIVDGKETNPDINRDENKAQEITKDEEKHLNANLHTDLANKEEREKITLAGRKVKTVVEALTEDKGTIKQNVIKAGLRAINIDELRKDKQKEFNLVDDKETAPLDKLIVLRDLQAELYKREGYTGESPELLLTDEPNSFAVDKAKSADAKG